MTVDIIELLQRLGDDRVLPQSDTLHSRGRDAQFELFVGAICVSAGFTPTSFCEPDVVCSVGSDSIGIAAKRVKSILQLEKRVRNAANQIKRSGRPGVIALDVCVGLNPANAPFDCHVPDDYFGEWHMKLVRRLIKANQPWLQNYLTSDRVLGMIFHDHRVRHRGGNEWGLSSTYTSYIQDEPVKGSLYERFQAGYFGAVHSIQRLDAQS